MNANERECLPAPQCCRSCAKCIETKSPSGERRRCNSDHPMHDGCGFYEQRKPAKQEAAA